MGMSHICPSCVSNLCGWNAYADQTEYGDNSLKGRASCHWRMIPALVPLVVCIIGIAIVLIWKSYYLTIPFAVGILFDLYPIYLSYIWDDLKSFSENNEQFREEVEVLHEENLRLATTAEEYRKELSNFREVSKEHTDHLEIITDSLSHVEEQAQKNHQAFDSAIEDLKTQISEFSLQNQELSEVAETIGMPQLDTALEELMRILDSLSEWKNAEEAARARIDQLNLLHTQQDEARESLIDLERRIATKQTREEDLIKNLEHLNQELHEQKETLKELRNSLQETVQLIAQSTQKLEEGTENNLRLLQEKLEELAQKLS